MKKINGAQKIEIVENIFRHRDVSIRKFASRGRKIGMDIPLTEDLISGYSLSLYCSDSIDLVAYWGELDEIVKWANELGIDTNPETVEDFRY